MLTGTEVKSLRAGRASLTDGFGQITDGEVWLHGVHIPEYAQGTWTNHEPGAPVSCCCTARRSTGWPARSPNAGSPSCRWRCTLRTGRSRSSWRWRRGKRTYDKRHDLAERDAAREVERAFRRRG